MDSGAYITAQFARGVLRTFSFLRDSFRLPFTPDLKGWFAAARLVVASHSRSRRLLEAS
jgi:hypothetical protein